MIWIWVAIGALLLGEILVVCYLLNLFGTLEEYLTTVTEELNYVKTVCKRVQASRERGADLAGLRRRVEALERDIDEALKK